ncbi:MAG TPA: spore germination protein [Clostridia bacterium]|nr:spore germination protein [Clostridia bacterium]
MPAEGQDNTSGSGFSVEDSLYNTSTEVTSDNLRSLLGSNADFKSRALLIRDNPKIPATLAYIDGLIDSTIINENILKPLAQEEQFDSCKTETDAARLISMGKVYYASMNIRTNLKDLTDDILSGNTALIFNTIKTAFTFESKNALARAISEPTGESVIKGAKDSFIEDLRTNTAICRKKIRSPYLAIEEIKVGKQSRTGIAIVYMKNIANGKLVGEVRQRLEAVDIDKALTPGDVEEYIIDAKYSTFPQVIFTERPDRFCVSINDGRVGIIIDGLPITYIVPGTLLQFIQTPDDYSYQFIVGSLIRFLRFLSMFITLVLPGFYICITTFHPEMIPTELTFSIIAAKGGVPFPMFVEVIIMLIAFELLVEAGLRLPKTIGQTVSIVGGLVVGQAAVEAKLVSPATVIIVAITAIASFTMPNQDFSNALRLWRFIFVIFSSTIGMFGLTFGLIFLLYHWCRMETFGVPYLDPFVANEDEQLQDTLFRLPDSIMKNRPSSLNTNNKKRVE